MGKSCYLCRIVFKKGDTQRSFHRFPDPQYQREAWCQSLRVDINKVSGWMCICSDHFEPDSFNYKWNGTRYLKDDAVPLFYDGPVRKRKYRSKKIKPEVVGAECETQNNKNRALDEDIKLESLDDLIEDNRDFIKTEDPEKSDIVVKTEITEEYDVKDEETYTSPSIIELEAKNECILKPFSVLPLKVELEAKNEGILKSFNIISPPNVKLEHKNEGILKPSPLSLELEDKNEGIIKKITISPPNFELEAENEGLILKPFELSEEFEFQNGDFSETSETNDISECEAEAREELKKLNSTSKKKPSKLANDPLAMRFKKTYPRPRDTNLYKCVECPFTTPKRTIIRRHFMGHRDSEFKKNPDLYEYKTHQCKECKYVTIQKNNLTRHMVKHQSLLAPQVKTYSCHECGYFTKYRCDLVRHRTKHVNVEHRFKCTKCEYGTHESKHLKEHLLKGHIEGKNYKYECEKCPYQTDCRGSLNRHIRESHSENRKFKYECRYCSFKIDSKWSWNKHMKGHTEISPTPEAVPS